MKKQTHTVENGTHTHEQPWQQTSQRHTRMHHQLECLLDLWSRLSSVGKALVGCVRGHVCICIYFCLCDQLRYEISDARAHVGYVHLHRSPTAPQPHTR